ncbi:hypothetical protein JAAARDRAFT_39892 [Jaapia argillacea MUCL 33604]|uniref:Enoyl reductase (ER) domain-containing protein n=1 Tax=Jaapia argillacea MUCL 33604 TaxID=933084 RepID=A0A067PQP7_9AGAM|nr:hypothetical protein JAAARDRAFT_39892 [Jaapia argillacea MUCL 33604]
MVQQKALLLTERSGKLVVGERAIPKVEPGWVLVKIEATALNPVDWKIQKYGVIVEQFPAVLGTDAAGIVEEVGEGVTNVAKGDRVLFQGWYLSSDRTTFQHFSVVPAEIVAKVPSKISSDQAASIPLGLATAALGLYGKQPTKGSAGLSPPWEEAGRGKYSGKPILVLGGSSSVGQFAIQLAALSGFSPIIATASASNTSFLKSIGVSHLIDRHTPTTELLAEVRSIIGSDPLEIVYDAVALPDTQKAGYELLSKGGQIVVTLDPVIDEETAAKEGKKFVHVFGNVNDPNQRETGRSLYSKLSGLLEDGSVEPNRVEVLPNGLEGIVGGLKRLEDDSVSGIKLVARPQETA